MLLKKSYSVCFFSLLLLAIYLTGCIKEYSYEGSAIPPVVIDTAVTPPVTPNPAIDLPACAFCNVNRDQYELWRWSFKVGNSFQCGTLDTAIVAPDRIGFTFFGPSSCSAITGMVITVYFDDNTILKKDQRDLVLTNVVFTYHTRYQPKYSLTTQRGSLFYLTLASYDYQTKMATGTFHGEVLAADGTFLQVDSGKFKVKLI